eukprot:1158100-Pelagomonas_calceolata.AAC.7
MSTESLELSSEVSTVSRMRSNISMLSERGPAVRGLHTKRLCAKKIATTGNRTPAPCVPQP